MSEVPTPADGKNPFDSAEALVAAEYHYRANEIRTRLLDRLAFFGLASDLSGAVVFRSDNKIVDTLVMVERSQSFPETPPHIRIFRSEEFTRPLDHTFICEEITLQSNDIAQNFVDVMFMDLNHHRVGALPQTTTFAVTEEGKIELRNPRSVSPIYHVRAMGIEALQTATPYGLPECFVDAAYALERTGALVSETETMHAIHAQKIDEPIWKPGL